MAVLTAIVYPDQETARKAYEAVEGLEEAHFAKVMEKALVLKDKAGKVTVDEKGDGHSILGGIVIGGLLGLLFTIPILGIAAGAVGGWLLGRDDGAQKDFNDFADQVKENLPPGGGAVMMLIQTSMPDRVTAELSKYGGTLYSTDLTDEQIAELQREIDKKAK